MAKSKWFKYNFNGRELDVWLVETKQKTTIKLDLYYNLEIRTPFKTVEEIIKEVGEETMNEWFEKAIKEQGTQRANDYANREEFEAFVTEAFNKIKAERKLEDIKLVIKWLANEYSRLELEKNTLVINWANEIKSKEFVLNELNERFAEFEAAKGIKAKNINTEMEVKSPTKGTETGIEIKDIKKTFGKKTILNDINITFEPGKVYGFIGNNGAGKTTLLRIIFNELKPDQGQIIYLNHPQTEIDYQEWMYFVENNELPKGMKAWEYLYYVATMADISKADFKQRLLKVKEIIKPNFSLKTRIRSLSAGQKKVLSCAGLLINQPKIIFLDEPTANLDPSNKSLVLEIINNLKNEGRIIVVITHLFGDIEELVTDLVILDNGVIKQIQPFKAGESIEKIFNKYVSNYDKKEKNQQIGEYLHA